MKKQNQIRKDTKAPWKSAQPKMGKARLQVARETPAPTAEPEIPESWKEVASIDFTGYQDRDCEERTIYKTPEGALKARRASYPDEPTVIEHVTRKQVVRWIHECIIPEEFFADFRPERPVRITVRLSGTFRRYVEQGAKKLNISLSRFIERAVREAFPLIGGSNRRSR